MKIHTRCEFTGDCWKVRAQ